MEAQAAVRPHERGGRRSNGKMGQKTEILGFRCLVWIRYVGQMAAAAGSPKRYVAGHRNAGSHEEVCNRGRSSEIREMKIERPISCLFGGIPENTPQSGQPKLRCSHPITGTTEGVDVSPMATQLPSRFALVQGIREDAVPRPADEGVPMMAVT